MSKKIITPPVYEAWMRFKRITMLALVVVMGAGPFMLLSNTATADQVSSRSLTISTAQASATANYTFTFTPGQTTKIQSIKFTACTTPLGSCTVPTGLNIAAGTVGQSGFQGGTAFTKDTTTAGCTTNNILCVTRTDITAQTITAHTVSDTGVTNQDNANCSGAANCSFFVRISTFSDVAYTTQVDYGNVAASTTQLFTVNAAVAEQLTFCIGSTSIDDATTGPPLCSGVTGTSLNLGTLNSANVSISPVLAANNGGDGNNGIAELSTNSSNGATVNYDSTQQTGTNQRGTLRVAGASCAASASNTDQCINAVGITHANIAAGTENFGMTVAAVNCASTTAYVCSFSGGTYNLARATNYNCDGTNNYPTGDANTITGSTTCKYAWDDTGTTENIASSTTVVDKEALILKFAATPNIVTPTGSYTAKADFVATPTY